MATADDAAGGLTFIEALSARLCHDLISPVSAVNNGLELIGELGGDPDGEALALVAGSGRDAARKLQFFRLAFGSARLPDGRDAGLAEARAAVLDYPTGARVALAWPDAPAGANRRAATKLALLLTLAALDGLGGEGTVTVSARSAADGATIEVVAAGPRASLAPDLAAALAGDGAGVTAKTAPALYAALTAQRAGGAIAARAAAGEMTLSARLPAGSDA